MYLYRLEIKFKNKKKNLYNIANYNIICLNKHFYILYQKTIFILIN